MPGELAQWLERPARADARRNYELLLTAAREAFAEHGTETSLEEIARRAGVGIGTLYRRFPNRHALLEAVYIDEIKSVCSRAGEFAQELPPFEALRAWLRDFVDFGAHKHAIAGELVEALGKESEFFQLCKTTVKDSFVLVLARAQEAGEVRTDVDVMDVMRLVGSINMTSQGDKEQAFRLLDVILDGLRARR
jgi:AcrR family transcriptional regulator